MTETKQPRHRLKPETREKVERWLLEQDRDFVAALCKRSHPTHPLDAVRELATEDLQLEPNELSRWSLRYLAMKCGVEIPAGKSGRPPTAAKPGSDGEDVRLLAREVLRLCRVLDLPPLDADGVGRIAGGR